MDESPPSLSRTIAAECIWLAMAATLAASTWFSSAAASPPREYTTYQLQHAGPPPLDAALEVGCTVLVIRGALLWARWIGRSRGAMAARTAVAALAALGLCSVRAIELEVATDYPPSRLVATARVLLALACAVAVFRAGFQRAAGWRREGGTAAVAIGIGAALSLWTFDGDWHVPRWTFYRPYLLVETTPWHGALALAGSALLLRHAFASARAARGHVEARGALRCLLAAAAAVGLCWPHVSVLTATFEHGQLLLPWRQGAHSGITDSEVARFATQLLLAEVPWLLTAIAAAVAAAGLGLAAWWPRRTRPRGGQRLLG